jgi:hypothetical protein
VTETKDWRTRLKATLAEELKRDPMLRERLERILEDGPIGCTTLAKWLSGSPRYRRL